MVVGKTVGLFCFFVISRGNCYLRYIRHARSLPPDKLRSAAAMVAFEKCLREAMNARLVGSGPGSMVLAHGYGGDQSLWEKILPPLSMVYRVLVFDWTFSGAVSDESLYDSRSYPNYEAFAADLIALMDEMNVKSSVFVGHSMSGMIGCIASNLRPDLFDRLVLVGASPRYVDTEGYEGGFKPSEVKDLVSCIEHDFSRWASVFPTMVVDAVDPPSVEKFRGCLQNMRPDVALNLAKIVFFSDYRGMLDSVTVPCVIVRTRSDLVVPDSVAYYMQKKIKGKSVVATVDTSGHFPQLTVPHQLVDVLTNLSKMLVQ